jgi:hypothetical protein
VLATLTSQLLDKKGKLSTQFELRVISGQVFEFEAKNETDAANWVKNIMVSDSCDLPCVFVVVS